MKKRELEEQVNMDVLMLLKKKTIKKTLIKRLSLKELFYVEDQRINSQTMIALLSKILDKQKKGKIHIVLDNARYYHSQIVKDF